MRETNSLFTEFSNAVNYTKAIEHKSELKILDLGCGTGGEILGILSFVDKFVLNVNAIKLLAIDGNQESLRIFEKVISYFKAHTRLDINYSIGPAFIENKEDLDTIAEIVSEQYDIILSCKAICELLAQKRFEQKPYKSIVAMLASKLTSDGVLFIEDVTVKSPATNTFIPIILNSELNEFVRENKDFTTLFPRSCANNENKCIDGCFFKREFIFSHSHKSNDVSKVVFRFIGKKGILNRLKITDENKKYNCKISKK